MKLYAALSIPFFLIAASPHQAQQLYYPDFPPYEDETPILDPELTLLINDVARSIFRVVEFHNDKFIKAANETDDLDPEWAMLHRLMAARWTGWSEVYPEWFVKKKVEASSTVVLAGKAVKAKNIETSEIQNMALLRWRSVFFQIAQLNENKAALGKTDDLVDLWSDWVDRINKLNKAVNELRKY